MSATACAALLAAFHAQPVPSVEALMRPPPRWSLISVNAEVFEVERRILEVEKCLKLYGSPKQPPTR